MHPAPSLLSRSTKLYIPPQNLVQNTLHNTRPSTSPRVSLLSRAPIMAASTLLLATNPAPVSPSSHLRQTLPSTTAAPRTSQPRSARRCVPASSPNPQQPIVHHLRSFLEAATVKSKCISPVPPDHPHFALGMHVQDGIAKRLQWKALHAEIARAHAVTTNTNSSMPPKATQQFLLDLSTSIANSVYDLLKDERCENEDARTSKLNISPEWLQCSRPPRQFINRSMFGTKVTFVTHIS